MPIRTRQIAHACILARDLAETRDFYREALGMEIVFNFTRQGAWAGFYLGAGGRSHIEVFPRAEGGEAGRGGIDHICLEVESLDAAIAHLAGRGIAVTAKKRGCDDTWQAWITDPNGVRIELFEYTAGSAQFQGGDRAVDW